MSGFRMFQSGLLILTNPISRILSNVPVILSEATKHVQETLYVHFAPELSKSSDFNELIFQQVPCTKNMDNVIKQLYSHAASHYQTLDIRIIIGNIGRMAVKPRPGIKPKYKVNSQILVTDSSDVDKLSLTNYVQKHFVPCHSDSDIMMFDLDSMNGTTNLNVDLQLYDNSCLGGTFDRLHTGHKILLSFGAMLSNERLIVGVTDGKMNDSKTVPELIEPIEFRIQKVVEFLESVKPELVYDVVPIQDPFGPSITDPNIQSIIVSEETLKGGQAVNKERQAKGMSTLAVEVIDLVKDEHQQDGEEDKISSSSLRRRLLGTLLRPPKKSPSSPYILGLTGGIASGKSSVCRRLEGQGAAVIDCDKLGHLSYLPGGAAYSPVISAFGEDIVAEDKTIDRRQLGAKIFGNDAARQRLNSIVWPVIRDLAMEEMKKFTDKGVPVIVLDAAVLLEAKWDEMCHEIWSTVIPQKEAVKRIMERNGLSEEESLKRITSQMSNAERVARANVVLCTLWDYGITQKQVERAWGLLADRISLKSSPPTSQ